MDDSSGVDICRVCRSEGLPERPLFHPCICTGSIKWIHQECLVQWMRYSRKEYCELCSHRFSFTPIYSPDMPRRLPLRDVIGGILSSIVSALKYWLHYTLVAFAWLGLVPLTACRVYRCLFSGSVESIISLPFDILKTHSILSDVFHGCFVLTCTLFAFLGMVWLREQIVHGGGPDWLEGEQEAQEAQQQQQMDQPLANDNVALHEDLDDLARIPTNINNNINNNNNVDSLSSSEARNLRDNGDADNSEIRNNVPDLNHSTLSNLTNNGKDGDTPRLISVNAEESVSSSSSSSSNVQNAEKAFGNFSNKDINFGAGVSHYNENNYFDKSVNNYLGTDDSMNKKRDQVDFKGNDFENNDAMSNENDYSNEKNYEEEDLGIHTEHFQADENASGGNQDLNQGIEPANEILVDENQNVEGEAGMDVPGGAENAQDDGNWNPVEWDRAVEELTWERLLGLDGSLVFLEHVIWVMSLNAIFIFCFAYLPYHFGNLAISSLGLREKTVETNFEGLITTLCGYCILGICLVILHTLASLFGLQKSKRIFGLCYVVVKVSLLSVIEIGVLPLICGWWLDICSLSMFDASLKDRETSFRLAPGTSMFIHWLVGMVYVYYFASFILLLREVVRPGVLWFLINFNDPDFSPIQEMIHTPIIHHIRRLLVSSIIFGTAVLLMFWFPVLIIRYLWPTFLPYSVALQFEIQFNELSLELLLFQVILPGLLEQSHTRIWMKGLLKLWCKCVAWIFGIHSYLLGDKNDENENAEQAENNENNRGAFNGLGAAHHQALLPRDGLLGYQPYQRPSWFYARLLGLLFAVCISLVFASLTAFTLPVWLGRKVMALWLGTISNNSVIGSLATAAGDEVSTRVHDLHTAAFGTYLCWLIARAVTILRSWFPQGRAAILDTERLKQWCLWGTKSLIACTFLLGIIPLLFGLLLELVLVVPIRVPLHQTPVLFVWHDWALGVLYTKIACATIIMGPDWKMRRAIERVYRDGIRNMDLSFILCDLAIPVTAAFSLALAVPYVIAHTIVPLIISDFGMKNLIVRMLYPCLLIVFMLSSFIAFQIRQFKKLYEHIKNDKYLVGKRLVNYDHRRS